MVEDCSPKAVLGVHFCPREDSARALPERSIGWCASRTLSIFQGNLGRDCEIARTSYLHPQSAKLSDAGGSRCSGEGGVSQVLPERLEIIFKEEAPEIVAHVAGGMRNVSGDLVLASL